MTRFGHSLLCEQVGPRQLVRDAARAERAGFDFEVVTDHVELMTYVTCPTMRYHPAVVAQPAFLDWAERELLPALRELGAAAR